jgi:hypothetical protein
VIRRPTRVQITGDLAVTEVEQVFFNFMSETVEGFIASGARAAVPEAAVDRNGRSRRRPRSAAGAPPTRRRSSRLDADPALRVGGAGSYRASIRFIPARRVITRYAE